MPPRITCDEISDYYTSNEKFWDPTDSSCNTTNHKVE